MTTFTRRGLIKRTSFGAAAASAMLAMPAMPGLAAARGVSAAPASFTLPVEPMAAFIRDAASGEIAVLIGAREVLIHDLDLVQRLARAAG